MPHSEVDGLIYAATGAACTELVSFHARLRFQVFECDVDVGGPNLAYPAPLLIGRQFHKPFAATLTISAVIHGQNIDAALGESIGKRLPSLAVTVALMEEDDGWARLGGGVKSSS